MLEHVADVRRRIASTKMNRGQSMVEALFAVGVIALVLSAVVVLLVKSVGTRTSGFDRNKAVRLGDLLVERLVSQKVSDPATFWQLASETNIEASGLGYSGYRYSVGWTMSLLPAKYPNCNQRVGVTDCAEANIKVDWGGVTLGGTTPSLHFQRFFSRK